MIKNMVSGKAKKYDRMGTRSPASVIVGFANERCRADETRMDLYSGEIKNEIQRMWDNLADEIGSDIGLIDYTDVIGYIRL